MVPSTLPQIAAEVYETLANVVTRAMYRKGITDFIEWLEQNGCPDLDLPVLERYRSYLANQRYSNSTVNQRLSAIRKLLRVAAEKGLLKPERALFISQVSGLKGHAVRVRRSLSVDDVQKLIDAPDRASNKGTRDRAILALLTGCGLARSEVIALRIDHLHYRQDRSVLLGIKGRRGRTRTIALPQWVKTIVDEWITLAKISAGPIFLAVERTGDVTDRALQSRDIFDLVKHYGNQVGIDVTPRDVRRSCAHFCWSESSDLEQVQLLLGHSNLQITERYLASSEQQPAGTREDRIPVGWQGRTRRAS